MIRLTGIKTLILLPLLLLVVQVQALTRSGHVIMVKGEANAVSAAGVSRPLKRRDAVYETDTIVTGEASRIQIRFIDQGLLALKANSELKIQAYHQATDEGDDPQVLLQLLEGGFRTLTGSIGKGNREAYKVETPVASIGVRGTLYSVRLQQDSLIAGVWEGGIRLSTPMGNYNLGMDADFAFGIISRDGFDGLLQPPAALDEAPAASARDDNARTERQQQAASIIASLPDSGDDVTSEQLSEALDALQEAGVDVSPETGLITREELSALLASPERAVVSSPQHGAAIAHIMDDDSGNLTFVRLDGDTPDGAIDRTEQGQGELATNINPPYESNIRWGIWNGSSETPLSYQQAADDEPGTLTDTFYWAVATPVNINDYTSNLTGSLTFEAYGAYLGADNNGNPVSATYGSMQLDLASGAISTGQLGVTTGDGETYGGNWNVNFTGALTTENGISQISTDISDGTYWDAPTGEELQVNTEVSSITAILTAPDAQLEQTTPNALSAFDLKSETNASITEEQRINGLVIWNSYPGALTDQQ